jgi:hypothetical protein
VTITTSVILNSDFSIPKDAYEVYFNLVGLYSGSSLKPHEQSHGKIADKIRWHSGAIHLKLQTVSDAMKASIIEMEIFEKKMEKAKTEVSRIKHDLWWTGFDLNENGTAQRNNYHWFFNQFGKEARNTAASRLLSLKAQSIIKYLNSIDASAKDDILKEVVSLGLVLHPPATPGPP